MDVYECIDIDVYVCLNTCIEGVNVLLPYAAMSVEKHLTNLLMSSVKHVMLCCEGLLCRKIWCNTVNEIIPVLDSRTPHSL